MINVENLKPFPKFCYTIGMIPTSYKVSLTYEEQLMWFCDFLQNTVIPTVINNGQAVQELQNLYVELKNYVDNYFENLDVQAEINNKLDEMVNDGTLPEIIASYLNSKAIFGFDNVESMKNATNLINGSYAKTLGFYSKNDGGSALYKIREITNSDVIDEMTLIAIGNNNNLVAELIITVPLSVKCLGAKGDNLNDDTNSIKTALNISNNILLPKGTYKTTSSIILNNKSNIIIDGNNSQLNIDGLLIGINFNNSNNITIKNLNITSLLQYNADPINHNRDIFIKFENCNNININNCVFEYGSVGIVFMSCENIKFTNNLLHDFKGWGCTFGASLTKCYNAIIKNNTSYNSSYDGIKLSGYIKDIIIQNNICYDNNSDGIDFAGHTAKNIIICNNDLHNNKLNGIDFKQLVRDTYPYDDDFIKEFENININDNLISNNLLHGINSQIYYNDVNVNNFNIDNNIIKMDDLSMHNGSSGIRIAPGNILNKGDIKIFNNNVDSKGKNKSCVRLSNAKYIEIYNNKLLNGLHGSIYIDNQNDSNISSSDIYIDNNELTASGDINRNVITFDNLTTPENIQITNNKMQNTKQSAYPITNKIFGSGFVFTGNSELTRYNEAPTGRGYKNMIYYAQDPSVSNCIGWIATDTSNNSTYKPYIPLQ